MDPLPTRFDATYFDGQTARSNEVTVEVIAGVTQGTGELRINGADGIITSWDLARVRGMRDQGHLGGLSIMPFPHATERLITHNADVRILLENQAPNLWKNTADRTTLKNIALWSVGALAAIFLIVFVLVPAIADRMAGFISSEREQKLGEATIRQITWLLGQLEGNEIGFCEDSAGLDALARIEARLTKGVQSHVPIKLRVIDHSMENALAAPGGHIVVFNGLLREAASAEEVAGVIGHEIGHVVNRDATRLALRTAGTAGILGLLIGDFSGGAVVLLLAERLISANYSQDAETSADQFAYELLNDAAVPTTPLGDFFDRMAVLVGESSGALSHLASHPDISARADAARAADTLSSLPFEPILSPEEWVALQNICKNASE